MSNSVKSVITNSAPPKETIIEVGKEKTLICYYDDPTIRSCTFYVYRLDGKPTLDGKKELIFKGRSPGGIFNSNETLKPKFSWFDKNEEEIRLAFDVSFSGERIPCKDQILIIKRGELKINLYWDQQKDKSGYPYIRVYAEFSENSNLDKETKIGFQITRSLPETYYNLNKKIKVSEETRTIKGNVTIVASEMIDLNYFFEWFCIVSLKAKLWSNNHNGFFNKEGKLTYFETKEDKEVRRTQKVAPNIIHTALEEQGLVPSLFYDNVITSREYADMLLALHKTLDAILDYSDSILNKKFKQHLYSQIKDLAFNSLQEWYNNRFKYRFYKEEYQELIEDFKRYRGNRTNAFRSWFVDGFGFNPDHPQVKKEIESMNQEKTKLIDNAIKFPFTPLRETDPVAWAKIQNLNKKLDNYERISGFYNEFESKYNKIETKTIKDIELMIQNSPNTFKY